MIFQALAPSTEVFAQELDAVMEASVSAARSVQDAVTTALEDAEQATSDDTAATPGADAGTTEDGNGSTNAGKSQDSTTDGTDGGDAPTEGDASRDDATADDGATDEEQTNDADAGAAAQANTAPVIKTVEKLEAALGDNKVTTDDSGAVATIKFGSNADLIAISNTDPAIYQNAIISRDGLSGIDFDVCSAKDVDGFGNLAFQGFGSDDYPFRGTLDLGGRILTVNKTLFNNIELSDDNSSVKLTWKGTDAQPIVAAKVAGEGKTLSATITVDKPNENAETSVVKLTSPLVGEVTGVLTLDATYATSANSPLAIDMQSSAGNLGLLVNTLAEGASLTLAGLTLSDKLNGTPTINATVSGANAGGLIGEARAGATVALPTGVDISALNVAGKNAAGGIIGKATNLTLTVGTDNSGKDASGKSITVKPAGAVGSSSASTYAGGLIGDASFAGEFTVNSGIFDFGGGVALSVSNTSVPPSAGGLFGVLDISNGDVTVSGGSYTSTLQNGTDNNSSARGNYGGLVGKLWGKKSGEALRAFTVQNGAAVSFSVGSSGKLTYAGGLVGYLGEGNGSPNVSAVVISDATVTCATSGYASNNGKYGGAVGVVDTNNVLEVRGLKVETASNATIGGSNGGFAGVVGSSRLGIVKFSGVTDLSDARFAENDHTAQLVYENFNSLIFAAGSGSDGGATAGDIAKWQYKRPATPVNIDDVYSYGQVIRLGSKLGDNLITINDSHQWSFDSNLVKTGEAFALANINDFAKLAITWQTSGYFSAVEGVTNSNFASQVPSANITLSADINLSGTGLTGLTKDRIPLNINGVDENSHSFTATLNGNGHAISLAVGEPYGMRGDSKIASDDTSTGNGKIYRHGRLGLFAAINGAAVSDVTIAGSLKFDNGAAIDAGSLAGAIAGGLTLSGATCKTNIACDDTFTNDVNIGGIAGSVSVASTVTFKNNSKAQATITTAGSLNGNSRIGGAIGYVGNYVSIFNVAGLEVGGKIETGNCASNKIAQVGGLIGCITQSTYDKGKIVSSADKYVNITDLSFNSFKMKVGRNGDALKGAGGLLGYSWGKTTVTIGGPSANSDSVYALNTSNDTTVTANDSTEVGGLVYAASGHWIINDYAINLGGASFTANNATTFGVLIARGSTSDSTNGFGAETSYSGLYLEDKAWWGTAYAVDGLSITAPKVEIYDEWLANGVKPKSKLIDNGCNAVVSLHTKGQKLDMSGDPAKDNSYRNRISPDKLPQANGLVRYYYNLDSALDVVTSPEYTNAAAMITPEHLILWAARQYAPEATYSDLTGNKKIIFTNNQIGLDRGDQITIDLTGYSYYPSNPNGANAVTVKNAKIVFCYSQIKAEQKNNKSNALATQHENMHCGLIRTIGGKDLTVTGVTLSGTVGRVKNDTAKGADPESVSGALVLRCAYGSSGTKMSTINIDTLTLDGLQVDGAEDREYAPLLINAITRYVNLDVKNVTTSNYADASGANKTAASSLFGRLGYDKNSDQVIAKFEKISLPSQTDNTIFTHASLLESLATEARVRALRTTPLLRPIPMWTR